MRLAAITFTESGVRVGRKLQTHYPGLDLYLKEELITNDGEYPIENPFGPFVGQLFGQYQGLIFIMAAGIVVRKIAPYLRDKKSDPAVVVVDDLGQHVISLLSGHLGGANLLTKEIAGLLKAGPVITTSTDLHRVTAFDLLADSNNMKLEGWSNLKYISGALIDGKEIGLFSDLPIKKKLAPGITKGGGVAEFKEITIDSLEIFQQKWVGIVLISHQLIDEEFLKRWKLPIIIIRPKNLVIGLGFRRGKSGPELKEAFQKACRRANICQDSISKIATIDHKKDEPGLEQLKGDLNLVVEILSKKQIKDVEDRFEKSELVLKVLGVGGVAEPSAYLGSNRGEMVLKKTKLDGITASIFKDKTISVE